MSRPTGRVLRRRHNSDDEGDNSDVTVLASNSLDDDTSQINNESKLSERKKRKLSDDQTTPKKSHQKNHASSNGKTNNQSSAKHNSHREDESNAESPNDLESKKEKLAQLVADHSILTNELFQLTEYKSLVYWDPLKNSQDKSELYENFKNDHKLDWNDEPELHNDLPLRLQRKLKSQSVNPHKEEILQRAKVLEISQLNQSESSSTNPTTSRFKAKTAPSPSIRNKKKGIVFSLDDDSKNRSVSQSNLKTGDLEQLEIKENQEDQEESSESEVESEIESNKSIPKTNIKKIKLNISVPAQLIMHPSNKPEPKFNSVNDFLNSYKSLDEDVTVEEYENFIDQQSTLLSRFSKGINNHILKLNDNCDRIEKLPLPPKFPDPIKIKATHYDHLLAQGMNMSKLISDSRKSHQVKAKKIAMMIEQHFRRKAGEGDRLKKEQERKLKSISRLAMQAVKKRWNQAEKVFRLLQKERDEEDKLIKGKEHLTQMLEHSTQLLEAQLNQREEDELNDKQDQEIHGSCNESGSDAEEVKKQKKSDDSNLTVEELRKKYADLDDFKMSVSNSPRSKTNSDVSSASENEESESESEVTLSGKNSLAALYESNDVLAFEPTDVQLSESVELTEEEKVALASQPEHNPLLDSDSKSSDSDDESLNSNSDSELLSDEYDDDDDGAETENNGLASLFGKTVDESDDESVHSTKSNNDKDSTPVSTPEDDKEVKDNNGVVDVPLPSLLKGNLRPYQKQGLNWLASLYNNNTNGILADEMGLGKTIQTIALVSYLACEKGIWGPHLIVVPTSVMLNWEMEFKRFAPGFKVMTYYGSPQQRKDKRRGWNNPDAFHVCITSYQLVVQDHQAFRRKRWRYMILDEAHNIKNFRSTRWQALLNFNTEHRLLLTGTPLQNNIMELWSLLYFLMPSTKINQAMPQGFANLNDFQQWFGKPVDKILELGGAEADFETKKTVSKLHQVLRPYLLRRLKADVEKQMPAKHEHIVYCRLSKRQRFLYDDFMSRAQTRETLASGNFLSIINCLMQLRKVCNHPDLFEVRPIVTSFAMSKSVSSDYQIKEISVRKLVRNDDEVNLSVLNLLPSTHESLNTFTSKTIQKYRADRQLYLECKKLDDVLNEPVNPNFKNIEEYYKYLKYQEQIDARDHIRQVLYLNSLRCQKQPLYGKNLIDTLTIADPSVSKELKCDSISEMMMSVDQRSEYMKDSIEKFSCVTPAAVALDMKELVLPADIKNELRQESHIETLTKPFHQSQVKLSIAFPDKSLLQYDCGKLQRLATLLQDLKDGGHRALIFTQMTKVLDILEQFLNIHGYRYMRLDGSTKIEDRQILTERFNTDPRITCFILSTRSGGLGINLTGADTVIFYDSDWNPAMDKQCQDRCHRIGQTRDVHIYRFVSEFTIESNILRKANQKRQLDNVVIQEGDFTTDYFGKFSVTDLLGDSAKGLDINANKPLIGDTAGGNIEKVLAQAEDDDDAAAANVAMKEVELDDEDFDENKNAAQSQLPSSTNTPSQTPAPNFESPMDNITNNTNINEEIEDIDYEDGVGHIDEYMIRFIAEGNMWD